MPEQHTSNANVPLPTGDRELTDEELDKVSGGWAPLAEAIRKAGKPSGAGKDGAPAGPIPIPYPSTT